MVGSSGHLHLMRVQNVVNARKVFLELSIVAFDLRQLNSSFIEENDFFLGCLHPGEQLVNAPFLVLRFNIKSCKER